MLELDFLPFFAMWPYYIFFHSNAHEGFIDQMYQEVNFYCKVILSEKNALHFNFKQHSCVHQLSIFVVDSALNLAVEEFKNILSFVVWENLKLYAESGWPLIYDLFG